MDKTFSERRKIEDKRLENNEETDFTYCEVCGACDREDTLLLCDGCDRGYHCECLNPTLANVISLILFRYWGLLPYLIQLKKNSSDLI